MTLNNSDNAPSSLPSIPRRRWIEAGLLLFFWGAVALLTLGREFLDPHLESGLREGEALHSVMEIAIWMLVTPLLFWSTRRLMPDRMGWIRTVSITVGLGVVIAVFADFVDHIIWNTLVVGASPRPLSIWYILDNFHFLNEFFVCVAILFAGFARAYFLRFQEHQQETVQLRMDAAKLQANLAEARLSALRMQINPHFLFNTLHVISDHFEENPRAARTMIARLSEILRYTLDGTETRKVPLSREIQFLDSYLDIQRFRFEDRLEVNIDIEPDAQHALVPTLILQPLVENAIKHGISQIEGQGIIEIRCWRENEELHIRIQDNGPGLMNTNGNHREGNGIGLRNTKERLEMLYGDNQKCMIESPRNGGFVAYITIPFHTSNDYVLSAVEVLTVS